MRKSEAALDQWESRPVKALTGDTFGAYVLSPTRDVLVMFCKCACVAAVPHA